MPNNLLILPLLGGFVFIRFFYYTRWASPKLSGQKLLIWSALCGVVLIAVSRALVLLINHVEPMIGFLWQKYFFTGEFTGTAAIAFILGCTIWIPINLFMDENHSAKWSIEKYGNELDRLISKSLGEKKQLLLTLNDSKVYVGFVLFQSEKAALEDTYFKLLPTISGYRDEVTKNIIFNTDYTAIYEKLWSGDKEVNQHLNEEDFEKYFKVSSIQSASIYDPDVSALF